MSINETLRKAMEAAQTATPEPEVREVERETTPLSGVVVPPHITIPQHDVDATTVSTTTAMEHAVVGSVKGLDEKAVLVQLKRRMYSPYKRDEAETASYGAGNVNKHLFSGPNNRVKKAMSAYGEVYNYVKDNTVPWMTGIELLNIDNYMDFTRDLRGLIGTANRAVKDLVDNWQDEVNADMARLTQIAQMKGKPSIANWDDYPTTAEMEARWGIDVMYMPVPTEGDFRVSISDEDKATLQQQLTSAERNAASHVIQSMIEPMTRAVSKLNTPIGVEGSVFRDSLVDNLVEVADRMNRVNISDDPAVQQQIDTLSMLVGSISGKKDALRANSTFRNDTARQIDELMGKMKGMV